MSPFQSLREYELFVYSLPDQFPRIVRSTLVVAQRGRYYAELAGEVLFPDGYRLNVYERLSWDAGSLQSKATATKSGAAVTNYTGAIRNPILTIRHSPAPILTTSIFRPISSITAFPHLA